MDFIFSRKSQTFDLLDCIGIITYNTCISFNFTQYNNINYPTFNIN